MRLRLLPVVFSVLLCCNSHAADLAAGKQKAELCANCHDASGISPLENTPSLAGQLDLFLQWQLIFFRSGTRRNALMQPIAEALSNEDVRNLGAYYASLPPMQGKTPDDNPELSRAGAQAAARHRCAACHLDSYAGSKAAARIAGQRADYLAKALQDYRSGSRAGGGMAAMADVAYPLSDDEITALAHYLAHFTPGEAK